jgi:6-pyruvoyltetrahydropterin/6-carboxytetrahydropterin synthase
MQRRKVSSQSITVRHNVEMAHRLWLQPDSKCHQLHGHSWWVEVEIEGPVDETGMIIDFATVKERVRGYLDGYFDHHTCLNRDDPLATQRGLYDPDGVALGYGPYSLLPGLTIVDFDPTVENMAAWWGQSIQKTFGYNYKCTVKVWEAATNAATWRSDA